MSEILQPKIYDPDRYLISTIIHKPAGKGPYPAVIILPGFGDGKDEEHYSSLAELLCNGGYLVVRFDPTGIGSSEGTVEEDYRISTYLNDVDTIITFLKHQGNIDEKRIGIWGSSLGGMLAVVFAAEYTFIKAVVTVSPPAFVGSSGYFKEEIPNWEKTGKLEIENSKGEVLKVPDSFLRESRKYSALTSAKLLKQPILTVVGAADTIVSPEDSKSIFDAVSGEKKLLEIPAMTHEYADEPENLKKVNEETKKFFDEYLK